MMMNQHAAAVYACLGPSDLMTGAKSSQCPMPNPSSCLPQGDLNLNIHEAHAFNTSDGFSLDVFVVDGWTQELVSIWWQLHRTGMGMEQNGKQEVIRSPETLQQPPV